MSCSHHESDESLRTQKRAIERFICEKDRDGNREFSNGRVSSEDDGDFAYAISLDRPHRVIKIAFPHPTQWIGMRAEEAEQLRDSLTAHLVELRAGPVMG